MPLRSLPCGLTAGERWYETGAVGPSVFEDVVHLHDCYMETNDKALQTLPPALNSYYRAQVSEACVVGCGGRQPEKFTAAQPNFVDQRMPYGHRCV
jgi:hypothetical protein